MEAIQAIETQFDGYSFRSRIEARWAVFMKTLGVRYEYEKEGYDLGDLGWYLPDFWLPDHNVWLEIKGQYPATTEIERCKALALGTMKVTHLSWAFIPSPSDILSDGLELIYTYSPGLFNGKARRWIVHGSAVWCRCPRCGVAGMAHGGDGVELSRQGLCECDFDVTQTQITYDDLEMLQAYEAARKARFATTSSGTGG